MAEFGAALIILVVFVVLPLLDLVIVPVRWMMAQEIVTNYVRTLATCETLNQSYRTMEADPSLATRLRKLGGVAVQSIDLHLRITRVSPPADGNSFYVVDRPGQIPESWLPDSGGTPLVYSLELDVQSLMSPAVLLPVHGISIPGLTAPIPIRITASHEWGNLGRNPRTGRFYVNE